MKTRVSFASNSLSCSFIVNDIYAFISATNEMCTDINGKLDRDWLHGIYVSFIVKNTEKNREIFAKHLTYWTGQSNSGTIYIGGCDLVEILDFTSVQLKQMHDVIVYVYDGYDDKSMRFPFFYYALRNIGIDVDNHSSEKDFKDFMSMPIKVMNNAINFLKSGKK